MLTVLSSLLTLCAKQVTSIFIAAVMINVFDSPRVGLIHGLDRLIHQVNCPRTSRIYVEPARL